MDSIKVEYNLHLKGDERNCMFFTARDHIDKVTVVTNGFTCEMTADEFFKIINEAFKW